jgi:hypothetical protein
VGSIESIQSLSPRRTWPPPAIDETARVVAESAKRRAENRLKVVEQRK